jgi:hypothetical protein
MRLPFPLRLRLPMRLPFPLRMPLPLRLLFRLPLPLRPPFPLRSSCWTASMRPGGRGREAALILPPMADCPSLHGFSSHLTVFTTRTYDPDDDDSLDKAKRAARTWVENEVQRQVQRMRVEQRAWEEAQSCEPPCVGAITEHEEPDGPIQVNFRVMGRGRVRALANMELRSTYECAEPETMPALPQRQR